MATRPQPHSDLAIPPGEYLQEVLEDLGMSQSDLARRMGRPVQAINEILRGVKSITPETALQLDQVTSVPAHIWTGLEEEFRLTLAKQQEREQLESEADLVAPDLYRALAKLDFVPEARNKLAKVREMWRFFGVSSLRNLPSVKTYSAAFRVSTAGHISPYAVAAWLRCGELTATEMDLKSFSDKRLKERLPLFRRLTTDLPQDFHPQLVSSLAECGVALVILPHLPKTRAQGATYWLSQDKVVVQMSIRGKWADIFWFSLFHELGHILLHGKRKVFVEDGLADEPEIKKLESEANEFASERLIPASEMKWLLEARPLTRARIKEFAARIEIDPGIVVGRLQHEGLLGFQELNDLRTRYELR